VTLFVMARRRAKRRNKPQVLPSLPASVGSFEAHVTGIGPNTAAGALPAPSARDRALAAARGDAARAARVLSAWLSENAVPTPGGRS
jgi:hypothetical protein